MRPAVSAPRHGPVVFVLPGLAGGGAERVVLTLAGALDRDRFAPELVVINGAGPLAAAVPAGIPLHDLGRRRLRQAIPALVRRLRRLRPAAIVSTLGHVNLALLALRPVLPPATRIILREANTPSRSLWAQPWPGLFRVLYRRLYPRADAIVCPSRLIARELAGDFGVPKARLHVLANPVDMTAIRAAAAPPEREIGRAHV